MQTCGKNFFILWFDINLLQRGAREHALEELIPSVEKPGPWIDNSPCVGLATNILLEFIDNSISLYNKKFLFYLSFLEVLCFYKAAASSDHHLVNREKKKNHGVWSIRGSCTLLTNRRCAKESFFFFMRGQNNKNFFLSTESITSGSSQSSSQSSSIIPSPTRKELIELRRQ